MVDITPVPNDYAAVLKRIKDDVRSSRARAAVAVNRELVGLYWRLGKMIVEQQKQSQWGRGVVERLATDLKDAFPDMRGFSPVNLWAMRRFYLVWTEAGNDYPRLLEMLRTLPLLPELPADSVDADESRDGVAILLQLVRELPWGHNFLLIHKIKEPAL